MVLQELLRRCHPVLIQPVLNWLVDEDLVEGCCASANVTRLLHHQLIEALRKLQSQGRRRSLQHWHVN